MYDLGKVLVDLRKKHGYTQAQAASRLGVSRSTIVGWENNYRDPYAQNFVDLAYLYGVPVTYLLGIDNDKMINISRFTDRQQEIITSLLIEFGKPNKSTQVLTQQQYTILNTILGEFYEKAHKSECNTMG